MQHVDKNIFVWLTLLCIQKLFTIYFFTLKEISKSQGIYTLYTASAVKHSQWWTTEHWVYSPVKYSYMFCLTKSFYCFIEQFIQLQSNCCGFCPTVSNSLNAPASPLCSARSHFHMKLLQYWDVLLRHRGLNTAAC